MPAANNKKIKKERSVSMYYKCKDCKAIGSNGDGNYCGHCGSTNIEVQELIKISEENENE